MSPSVCLASPRKIGDRHIRPVGLGCMNLSHAYGRPPAEKEAIHLLNRALDLGYQMLDTAALYGFGANEELLRKAVGHRRDEYLLASKCGMFKGSDGKRVIDGRPQTLRKHCEASLKRLGTDVIDLYYLHRWDKRIPVEESMQELARLVEEGKIRQIGLSEVSAQTLIKASSVHPVAAVQTEYSLWTRNPEIAVLETCHQLGTAFVAFSPLGRGMLTATMNNPDFDEADIRRNMPRFRSPQFEQNRELVATLYRRVSEEIDISPGSEFSLASVVLAWVLGQSKHIHVIPGTTSLKHLEENQLASQIPITHSLGDDMGRIINRHTVQGSRYHPLTQQEIDTEEFVRG